MRIRPTLLLVSLLLLAGGIAACSHGQASAPTTSGQASAPTASGQGSPPSARAGVTATTATRFSPLTAAHLQPGSDPKVLPAPLLIADRNNNRLLIVNQQGQVVWEFPRPGDLSPGQTFLVPDDAFFTPDGRQIVVTQEDEFVITVVDVATHRIVYRYGTPGVHGMGPNQLWNPDDAMQLPDGYLIAADIKNCRVLLIPPRSHVPFRIYGVSTNQCYHQPPSHWGSPNGAFPMSNGHYVVTEINGDWVDELGLDGTVHRSTHPPGLAYPSDTNEVSPGVLVTVDYSNPGTLETFDWTGKLLWRYQPLAGDPPLDQPSLALPLPNGDFLVNDDYNHRVVVIDPRSNRIVWQYGVTGHSGSAPGFLDKPDGMDLAPPHSFVMTRASTIGQPTP